MKIKQIHLRNFRRLEDVAIDLEENETVFVGPNNSGKTSATAAFRLFLKNHDFRVYDFSVSRIAILDAFGANVEENELPVPAIEMDLWLSVNPDIEFGRVFSLIPSISSNLEEVGIRLRFGVKDSDALKADYLANYPRLEDGKSKKSLSHFLTLHGNLARHFSVEYFALERNATEISTLPLDRKEGSRVLHSLVRVDFVDAQRNIDDQEAAKSTRLSSVFATFYRNNLEQAEISEDANRIIDENNDRLTKHYQSTFNDLMEVIQSLGVPSINDREMKIISSLSSEVALQGNTSLIYIDANQNHELPEAYNGLGFKNLIYIAIQICHFHLQWIKTEEKRPLCQIMFVEEPEVHLHAQVQQTFITNVWEIIKKASERANELDMAPQLVITTHSSHILDAVEFGKVRYFRRCESNGEIPAVARTLNASKVLSLRNFRPERQSAGGEQEDHAATLHFLKRYLKLTHCDLFFADAAILIEGTVEKLLLPHMIDKSAEGLRRRYLSTLEVGGAYSHRFASLLEYLAIPYLVITDIDAVDPSNNRASCRADTSGAVTSNKAIDFFLDKAAIDDLIAIDAEEQSISDGNCFVAFQKPVSVTGYEPARTMFGRTFEETFIFENIHLFRNGEIDIGVEFPGALDHEREFAAVHERVQASTFKKTTFALDVASSATDWSTPQYISEGLAWLNKRLASVSPDDLAQEAVEA